MQRCKTPINLSGKTILVTGSPGFIGFHLVMRLLPQVLSGTIVSFDNMNDYYDISLKLWRLDQIENRATELNVNHVFEKGDLSDQNQINRLFEKYDFDIVVNLAGQAGVRHSIDCPEDYLQSNVIGFYNILEACRNYPVKHLVFASSSSVYGMNKKIPFSTSDNTDTPVSLYAASKKSNELMAFAYSNLYGIPTTGLRFFTVYGPAGRPDMFYFTAAEKMMNGESMTVYNNGNMERDFTYIDDIVEGITRVIVRPPYTLSSQKIDENDVPYAIYNIGKGKPENIMHFLEVLCHELTYQRLLPEDYDLQEHVIFKTMQKGDVLTTFADTDEFYEDFGFKPELTVEEGLSRFVSWLSLM